MTFITLLLSLTISLPALCNLTYQVSCENKDECPEWVTGLISRNPTGGIGLCSGSLIQPDLVVTNYHCLPEDLRKKNATCENRIYFNFPKTAKLEFESAECLNVVDVSPPLEENNMSTDLAFLKLKKPLKRAPIELNQNGFPDMSMVTIYKIDPVPNELKGLVKKIQCQMVQKTMQNPYFVNSESPLVSMIDCPIIQGNSGSAIVFGDGTARGVVSNIFHLPVSTLKLSKKTFSSPIKKIANGTNFSCLNTFFLPTNKGYQDACYVKVDVKSQNLALEALVKSEMERMNLQLQKKMEFDARELAKKETAGLHWQLAQHAPTAPSQDFHTQFTWEPKCLPEESPFYAKDQFSLNLSAPTYFIQFGLDEWVRYKAELSTQELTSQFDFSLDKQAKEKVWLLKRKDQSSLLETKIESKKIISTCPRK